jgi:hypothetical protein
MKQRINERIIKLDDADAKAKLIKQNSEWAAQHPVAALPDSDPVVQAVLADGISNFLGSGSFSRVYVIDDQRVLKLSRDLASLKVMAALCSRSSCFPRIDLILESQASDDDSVYHAAVVERLEEGYPEWIRAVVDGYRQPFRADSGRFAHARLLDVSLRIAAGDIVVPLGAIEPLSAAMRILAEECLTNRLIADLRYEGNFMMRVNGDVVIADPAHPEELI